MILINNPVMTEILEELDSYRSKSKADIFKDAIENKLKASVIAYNNEVDLIEKFLTYRKELRVLKAVKKLSKEADKKIIIQNMDINKNEK